MCPRDELPPDELTPAPPPDEAFPRPGEIPEELRTKEVRALVERAKKGEVDALNELFSRYYATMLDLARRRLGPKLRAKEEADDLAQTTFREAVRDFSQYEYRGEDSLLRWLVRILQNKIRDRAEFYGAGKRDATRERLSEDRPGAGGEDLPAPDPPSDDLSVTRQVVREEEFAILRQALEELSADHRLAITLVFFQGLTLRKAGERMGGRSEDAVRMLLRRAEARLRELTKRHLQK
ncbi:MAG: sigma-70 family RNA polymerase sigma factor [Planctomycetota bacterium]